MSGSIVLYRLDDACVGVGVEVGGGATRGQQQCNVSVGTSACQHVGKGGGVGWGWSGGLGVELDVRYNTIQYMLNRTRRTIYS